MGLGLEQEDMSWITSMALAYFLIQLETGRGLNAKTCGLDDVFSPDNLGSVPYTQFVIIYILLQLSPEGPN